LILGHDILSILLFVMANFSSNEDIF